MIHAHVACSILLVALALPAQTPPQAPARDTSTTPKATAVVRGRVVTEDTGAPVRDATVSLRSSELKEPRAVTTDAQGRYEIRDLAPGRYSLQITPSRYKPMYLGTTSWLGTGPRGRLIDLGEGQILKDVDFALRRAAALNGRVVDEFGEPLANVRVLVLSSVPGRGPTAFYGGMMPSDDYGRFRVFGLEPGDYLLKAEVGVAGAGGGSASQGQDDYVPTYYPSTTNPAEAPLVKVDAAQELTDLEIRMVRSRTFRISGLVLDSQGRPAVNASVMLSYQSEGFGYTATGGVTKPDGTFEFRRLAPGTM